MQFLVVEGKDAQDVLLAEITEHAHHAHQFVRIEVVLRAACVDLHVVQMQRRRRIDAGQRHLAVKRLGRLCGQPVLRDRA